MIEGIIYRLDFEDGTCYVGSTQRLYFCQRASQHKHQNPTRNGYIHEVTKRIQSGMECISRVIKKDLFFNKYDLLYWERILTELTPNTLNKRRCWRTTDEENEQIKTTKSESDRKYREKNNSAIKAFKNQKFKCECGKEYTHSNKTRHIRSKFHQDYLTLL